MFQRLKMNNILDIDNLNKYYRQLERYEYHRGGRSENYSIREYFRNLSKKTKKIGEFDSNLDYLNEEIFIIFNGIGDKCSNFTNEKQKVNYIRDLSKMDRIFGYSNLQNKKEQKENESISELKNEINKLKKEKAELEAKLTKKEEKNFTICKVINKEISNRDLSVKPDVGNASNEVEMRKMEKTNDEYLQEIQNKD